MNTHLTLILALISPLALAGGSHYGTPADIPAGFSGVDGAGTVLGQ